MTPDAADIFEHGYPLHDPKSRREMDQLIEVDRYPIPKCPVCQSTIAPHQAYVLKNPLQKEHFPDHPHDLHCVVWCDECKELMTANVRWFGKSLKITSSFQAANESAFLVKGALGRIRYRMYLWASRIRHGKKAIRPDEA